MTSENHDWAQQLSNSPSTRGCEWENAGIAHGWDRDHDREGAAAAEGDRSEAKTEDWGRSEQSGEIYSTEARPKAPLRAPGVTDSVME